jgi:3-hydroxybutyrate dehydrogenase
MQLTNKTALITGAASGIGRAIAERFAEAGANIIIADINLDSAEKTAKTIAETTKQECIAVTMDVSQQNSVANAFAIAKKHFPQLDIVVNNAGVQIISPLAEFPLKDWQKLIDIHLNGSFYVSQLAQQWMMENGNGGRILFIGSVHSFLPSMNKSAYIAAKHAQLGLMRAIAKEGAPYGIGSNLIAPGFVKTPLVEKQIPEQAATLGVSEEHVVKQIMLGQTVDGEFTTLNEVAETTLFFAAFPTLALTGQSLLVSHGWFMD